MTSTTPPEEDATPVSVRLGAVVPPEDPEDWTRPLTWVAAAGMLAAPAFAALWFLAAAPSGAERAVPATFVLAALLAAGAAATGATQLGSGRAAAATLGAALFAALVVVLLGAALGGGGQPGVASPTLAHAFAAALAGVAGAVAGSLVAAAVARRSRRPVRFVLAATPATGVAVAVLALVAR